MKALLLFVLVLSFFGCEKDPYPAGSLNGENGNVRSQPRKPDRDVRSGNSLDVKEVLNLEEGTLFTHKMRVVVPQGTKPVAWVENLPAGAEFNKENLTLKWQPGFFTGNDPKDPSIKTFDYVITVWFKNDQDEMTDAKFEKVILRVKDIPQNFQIDTASSKSVREGQTLYYNFKVTNFDYPKGPFKIQTEGMPANTMVEKIDENNFRLVFKPDYQHVKINDNPNPCSRTQKDCLSYEGKILVTNPANHVTDKKVEIEVRDKREDINIVTPDNMQQGLDISFSISVVDPNGEVAPRIKLRSNQPQKGEFATSLQKDEENNLSVFNVTWKDIPPIYNGRSEIFRFEACVLGSRGTYDTCDRESFTIRIVVKDRKPPVFERNQWSQGEIKYLKFNESKSFKIGVKDGDNRWAEVDNVQVKPAHIQKYVSFRNGKLSVRFDKPGLHQFSLVAVSDYNLSSAESFVLEVFPKERSKTLYFTDSTRDNEAKFFTQEMNNVELMNPVLQPLNTRNLSGRENLILGTGILQDLAMRAEIERAMSMIDNVVIASPILQNMPDKFIDALTNDYKISILGRYSQLQDAPDLDQMYFVVRSDFQSPKDKIQLKLDATSESLDPLIFSISVDRKNCQDVMDFTNRGNVQRASQFKIGLICDRMDKNGRFAILGTEFADLKTSMSDKQIPGNWLRKMLTTRLSQAKE